MSPLKHFVRLILIVVAAVTALAGLSAIHDDVGARRETAQKTHEIAQNDLLRFRAYATPRSIADFFPRGP